MGDDCSLSKQSTFVVSASECSIAIGCPMCSNWSQDLPYPDGVHVCTKRAPPIVSLQARFAAMCAAPASGEAARRLRPQEKQPHPESHQDFKDSSNPSKTHRIAPISTHLQLSPHLHPPLLHIPLLFLRSCTRTQFLKPRNCCECIVLYPLPSVSQTPK